MAFEQISNELKDRVIDFFKANNKYATGRTAESFEFEITQNANGLNVEVSADDSAQFVLEGRAPGSTPPPVSDLQDWLNARRISTSSGFFISRAIGRDGILPFDWTVGVEDALDDIINRNANIGNFDDVFLREIFLEFGRV